MVKLAGTCSNSNYCEYYNALSGEIGRASRAVHNIECCPWDFVDVQVQGFADAAQTYMKWLGVPKTQSGEKDKFER